MASCSLAGKKRSTCLFRSAFHSVETVHSCTGILAGILTTAVNIGIIELLSIILRYTRWLCNNFAFRPQPAKASEAQLFKATTWKKRSILLCSFFKGAALSTNYELQEVACLLNKNSIKRVACWMIIAFMVACILDCQNCFQFSMTVNNW